MGSVKQLQDEFARSIYEDNSALISGFIVEDGIASYKRLNVYRNNNRANLTNSLRETYPAICAFVSEGFFCYAASEYIKQYPSKSGNLDDYGRYFADFFTEFTPVQKYGYLPSLARLEWLLHEVYLQKNDGCNFTVASFDKGSFNEDCQKARVSGSIKLLQSPYNLAMLHKVALVENEYNLNFAIKKQSFLVIFRTKEFEVIFKEIDESSYLELKSYIHG